MIMNAALPDPAPPQSREFRRCRRGGNFGAAEKLGRLAPLQSRELQRRREVRNGFAHSRKCIAA